jgi:hypothetical protein
MAQIVEHFPSMHEALGSICSTEEGNYGGAGGFARLLEYTHSLLKALSMAQGPSIKNENL